MTFVVSMCLYLKEQVNLRDSAGIPLYIGLCFGYAFSTFYTPVDYPRTAPHGIGRFITFSFELTRYLRNYSSYLMTYPDVIVACTCSL